MEVPMNISRHREVGDLTVEVNERQGKWANETPYQNDKTIQEEDHKTKCNEKITTPNVR